MRLTVTTLKYLYSPLPPTRITSTQIPLAEETPFKQDIPIELTSHPNGLCPRVEKTRTHGVQG